jgi:uncharacterized LabA/DUF88 family protein
VDFANLDRAAADHGHRLDYRDFREYIGDGRLLVESFCYVPIDPRRVAARDRLIDNLWTAGFVVITKVGTLAGDSYRCNFDIEIVMDMMRVALSSRPDIIVLASGDGDFVPVVLELRRLGVRVEVASYVDTAGRELILKCSDFIDVEKYVAGGGPPEGNAQETALETVRSSESDLDAEV